MIDIKLQQTITSLAFDIAMDGSDLLTDDGLETAVVISLFSDGRATIEEMEAAGYDDQRGWWGDVGDADGVAIGSKLWLLKREKVTNETIARAREYTEQALRWMIDDGIASATNVIAERGGLYQISIGVAIIRPNGTQARYSYLWEGQRAAA